MSEINFAKEILKGRNYKELTNKEILNESARILDGWMNGDLLMERPKLYDHYALLLLALIKKNQELEQEILQLKNNINKST